MCALTDSVMSGVPTVIDIRAHQYRPISKRDVTRVSHIENQSVPCRIRTRMYMCMYYARRKCAGVCSTRVEARHGDGGGNHWWNTTRGEKRDL